MKKEKNIDIKQLILTTVSAKGNVDAAEIIKKTGFSRAYVNRFFQELRREGKIILLGKSNKAHYVFATKIIIEKKKKQIVSVHRILKNKSLNEDSILQQIKESSGIFAGVAENISHILEYAFLEMLNNAIEHSKSKIINLWIDKSNDLYFCIVDKGLGIFNHIRKKYHLKNEYEAIQDLLKGKLTTSPDAHSGEGIFFTSKVADKLVIRSSNKKLIFDNVIHKDIFVEESKNVKGTEIEFWISRAADKKLLDVFRQYSGEEFDFNKTNVKIELYKSGKTYISRSQARRVISGLEKFKDIVIDFKNVSTIGQGFADEIFRVWQNRMPDSKLIIKNANENIIFMINHVKNQQS
jgi:anti-sigma regulatory factor (Ser/Thr protein kinase)